MVIEATSLKQRRGGPTSGCKIERWNAPGSIIHIGREADLRQNIDIDTVNDMANVRVHTGVCVERDTWCCAALSNVAST